MESREQRIFWDRHIASWSASAYGNEEKLPLIERIARPFRGHLRARQTIAVDIAVKASATAVLELGCGTGEFAAALIQASATLRRYEGIDISESAIVDAQERVRLAANTKVKASLRTGAVEDLNPPSFANFDFIVGLGLLPYLTDEGFEKLASLCRGRSFLLDDHPKERSLFNAIHLIYRKVKRYPFYRMFSEEDLNKIMSRFGFGPFEIIRRGPVRFIRSV